MIFGNFHLLFVSSLFLLIMIVSICFQKKHILSILLSLEGMMLGLFLMLILSFSSNAYLSFVFLCFIACEASLGLSLLVKYVRSHGNDYVYSMTVNQF